MKKLFLASWFAGSSSLLPSFAGEAVSGKTVAFIPTASSYSMPDEEKQFYDWLNDQEKLAFGYFRRS